MPSSYPAAPPTFDFTPLRVWPADAAPPLYPWISAARWGEDRQGSSPDPVAACRWSDAACADPLAPLQCYALLPVAATPDRPGAFAGLETLGGPGGRIRAAGVGTLALDFGVVSAGWLEFECDGLSGHIEASVSEHGSPAIVNLGAYHAVKTRVPTCVGGDTYRLVLNPEYYEGVRFAWLHVRSLDRPITIRNLRLVCQTKPVAYAGAFSCDDPELTRAWHVAAYTVRLNLLQDHLGAILMERSDRHSWTGDAYVSQQASLSAFWNPAFVRHNLVRMARDSNGILAYDLYWLLAVADYATRSGDATLFDEYADEVTAKLDWAAATFRKPAGLMFMGHDDRLGGCFETPDCAEATRTYRSLVLHACRTLADAHEGFGRHDTAAALRRRADDALAAVSSDAILDRPGVHATAQAILAGLPLERLAPAIDRVARDRIGRVSYSPFNTTFIVDALARAGRHAEALETIHDCWGGMLRLGATTFWESYRPEWNAIFAPHEPPPNGMHGYTSLCHPWSAGVVRWIGDHLLGVTPAAPGFATFHFRPWACPELGEISGAVPTPHGPVVVHGSPRSGTYDLTVPAGTEAMIEGASPSEAPRRLGPGRHAVAVRTVEPRKQAAAPQAIDARKIVAIDRATEGDWQTRYGRLAHLLVAVDAELGDVRATTPPVASITTSDARVGVGKPARAHWASGVPDRRALVLPGDERATGRALGALTTRSPWPCHQSFYVDIAMTPGEARPVRVTVYCCDFNATGASQTIDMLDLDTLRIAIPTVRLDDFTGGVYVSFQCAGSVRIRFNSRQNGAAFVSAVFVDHVEE